MKKSHEWLDGVVVEPLTGRGLELRHHECLRAADYRRTVGSMAIVGTEGNIGGVPEGDIVGSQPFTCGACGGDMSTYHGENPRPLPE